MNELMAGEPTEQAIELDLNGEHLKLIQPNVSDCPKINHQILVSLGVNKDDAEYYSQKIDDFLRMPIVVDNFSDHQNRRRWRSQTVAFFPEEKNLLYHNKLRANMITSEFTLPVTEICNQIIDSSVNPELTEKAANLKSEISLLSLSYYTEDTKSKISQLSDLEDKLKNFINLVNNFPNKNEQ